MQVILIFFVLYSHLLLYYVSFRLKQFFGYLIISVALPPIFAVEWYQPYAQEIRAHVSTYKQQLFHLTLVNSRICK